MLIIPAIDLKDGCVVRLVQGKFSEKKIYSRDPLKTARHWAKQGAKLLHLVDLDGAKSGVPKNIKIAEEIAAKLCLPLEFGGGVRSMAVIKRLLKSGAQRVVLGTKALEDKDFLKKAFAEFKEQVIVSIDAKDGKVALNGWQRCANTEALEFAIFLKKLGFKQLIYTDTLKDGMLKGPNIRAIKTLLKETGLGVIASGGVSSLEDIRKLGVLQKDGLVGVIIGKALYEGKFTLTEALKFS
jgi:phosphoribosylformimino-5-aminoimidazole carboxamide ribotide isomerase